MIVIVIMKRGRLFVDDAVLAGKSDKGSKGVEI